MYSSHDIARMVGCSYRQLDYWVRSGVISPLVAGEGSGSRRRWLPEQARIVRMLADLAALGARTDVLRRAAVCASRIVDWSNHAYVDDEGNVSYSPPGGSCWVIDLENCASRTGLQGTLVA
jgi:hypothetical protein